MILSAPGGFYDRISGYQDTTIQVPITQPGEMLEAYMQQSSYAYNIGGMGEVEVLPSAQIDIDNTTDKSKKITLYNPPPPGASFGVALPLVDVQKIPVTITNTSNAEATFNVVVNPDGGGSGNLSGSGLLSQPLVPGGSSSLKVKLAAHADIELMFTPTQDSFAANDVHIIAQYQYKSGAYAKVAEDDMTVVSVTFDPDIRNTDTPAAMQDRIPPGADQGGWVNPTSVFVQVTPDLAGSGGQFVTLYADGEVDADGSVSINHNTSGALNITLSQTVELNGMAQTEPGHAGNLRLTVEVRGQDTAQSKGFSVSAIPVNFDQVQGFESYQGTLYFSYDFDSDSGSLSDLNQVWVGSYATFSDGGKHVGTGQPWTANDPSTIYPTGAPPFYGPNHAEFGLVAEVDRPPGRALPLAGPTEGLKQQNTTVSLTFGPPIATLPRR